MKIELFVAVASVAIVSLAGCGGSGSAVAANPFANTYNGNVTLDGGKAGAIAVSVNSSGTASGSLTVTAPAAFASTGGTRSDFLFTIGTHTISGNVSNDGTFHMTGSDPTYGTFSMDGNLTLSGSSAFTVTGGGTTYTGSINASVGGGSGSVTFGSGSGTNANLAAFPSNPYIAFSSVAGYTSMIAVPSTSDTSRNVGVTVGTSLVTGNTYTFTGDKHSGELLVSYGEGDKTWYAESGTATIVSRSASGLSIRFNDVVMAPMDTTSGATGTFHMSGTLTK